MKLLVLIPMALACLLIAACGEDGPTAPTPAPSPTATAAPRPTATATPRPTATATPRPTATAMPEPVIFSKAHPPPHYGAATPSLSERILESVVVVRASLLSAAEGELRFRAIEYLKGTGAAIIVVSASTAGRQTTWDGREAVLFLDLPAGTSRTTRSSGLAAAFRFADAYQFEHEGSAANYEIGTRNPVWLPAANASDTGGALRSSRSSSKSVSSSTEFITDTEAVTGGPPAPTISLADLRAKIAWMEGGAGIAGYGDCVKASVDYARWYRDWEAYNGQRWVPAQFEEQVASGAGAGALVHDLGPLDDTEYARFWITGQDAALFHSQIADDDAFAYNGYRNVLTTVRPLPGGAYRFVHHGQSYFFIPCTFIPVNHRLAWTVTVTAPAGTLHEAFFDPVAIGTAVGADATNGVVEPPGFTVGGMATTVQALKWESGIVTMELSAAAPLVGYTVDFIALDGSVSLTLSFDDAVAGDDSSLLTWALPDQPWHAGDQLMLRIREARP